MHAASCRPPSDTWLLSLHACPMTGEGVVLGVPKALPSLHTTLNARSQGSQGPWWGGGETYLV